MKRMILFLTAFILTLETSNGETNNAVYLHEGFNGGVIPAGWNQRRLSGAQAAWNVVGQGSNPTVNPYAGTGQAKFNSFDAAAGEQARLTSASINLSSSTDPFLTFWMYHEDEYLSSFDSIYVEATTTDSVNGPWTVLAGVRRPTVENRWAKEVISLYQYRTATRLFLSVRGVSKYGNNIFVDEFRVADSTFTDIGPVGLLYFNSPAPTEQNSLMHNKRTNSRVVKNEKSTSQVSLSEPLRVSANAPANLGVMIRNYGTSNVSSYVVSWRINAVLQTPVTARPIAARVGRDTIALTWATPIAGTHTITAWTVLASDSSRTNDTTRLTIQVLDTSTVFYESFNGGTFPPSNWLVVNRDGGALAPWFRGADTSAFVPFDGSGFAANNFQRANNRYIDDYLITPQITNVGQSGRIDSLIFWVRSKLNTAPAPNYPDSLMVLMSTGGADTSNFTIQLEYFSVPKTGWTRKAYRISDRVPINSTIRIAFRYLLYDAGFNGNSGDFLGIDAVQVVRKGPTGVDGLNAAPTDFALHQNYPNPFNPSTTIGFKLQGSGFVALKVFDVLGREVATLLNEQKQSGDHLIQFDASRLSSGVYYYRLQTGAFVETKTMLLLR